MSLLLPHLSTDIKGMDESPYGNRLYLSLLSDRIYNTIKRYREVVKMIILYYCECCMKGKEWCEMSSYTLCKNCWAKKEHKKRTDAGTKMQHTKRLQAKTKRILEL